MPTADSAVDIVAKCTPRLAVTPERCGGLTVCNLAQTTVSDLDTLYKSGGDFRVDHVTLEADFIGKAVEAKQNSFYDAMRAMSRASGGRSRMGSARAKDGRLIYEPFIRMSRQNPINNNFWQGVYVSGPSSSNYVYDLTSSTGVPSNTGFFPENVRVFITGVNKETGAQIRFQAKVVSAAISSGKIRVTVTAANAGSVAAAATKAWPGTGDILNKCVFMRGTTNVNDYESDCPQLPALNTTQEAYFWVEQTRYALCESELTQQYLKLLLEGNPLYKKFYHTPDVEYNRQVIADWQMRCVTQFLFGQPSSANQTASDWKSLPEITLDAQGTDLPWDSACVGRKADAVGIIDQLVECDRVWDLEREALDLPTFFSYLYQIKRTREAQNIPVDVIEIGMDSQFAIQFQTGMLRYFNMRSEGLLRVNQALPQGAAGEFGFKYWEFYLDYPSGQRIRVVTHPLWDDLIDAHRAAYQDSNNTDFNLANSASQIWIIDWATSYQEILETNKVVNVSGDLQQLAAINGGFGCVMKVPKTTYRLNSQMVANIVECPPANLLIVNYDRCTVPTHTGDFCGNAFMVNWDPSAP